jgi:phosphoglycerol transferase MdoB-like AlkP superfamily enzyme
LSLLDIYYFKFNLKRINFTSLNEWYLLNNKSALLFSFLKDYTLFFVVGVLLTGYLIFCTKIFSYKPTEFHVHKSIDLFIVSSFLILAGLRGGSLAHAWRPIGLTYGGKFTKASIDQAIVSNTTFSILKSWGKPSLPSLNYFKTARELEKAYSPIIKYNDKKQEIKPNVVILVIESYSEEARLMGFTPFLDSLRSKSKFAKIGMATGKKSIDALPAIWSGIAGLGFNYVLSPYAQNHMKSLGHLLKEKAYSTHFFHGAPNGSMGFDDLAAQSGIDHYYGKNEYNKEADFDGVWGIWDEPFLKYTATKMDSFKEPFFSTIFTLSSHDPFKVPTKYEKRFKSGPHPIYKTLAYTDFALKEFFNRIKNKNWFNNTLFVITADHTASYAHLAPFKSELGRYRIPLFFYSSGLDIHDIQDITVFQTDIAPTILSIMHHKKPFFGFGKNVLQEKNEKLGVIQPNSKSIFIKDSLMFSLSEGKISGMFNFVKDFNYTVDLRNKISADKRINLENQSKAFLQQYSERLSKNKTHLP